jgi:lipopolysaccharide export system protein LptA
MDAIICHDLLNSVLPTLPMMPSVTAFCRLRFRLPGIGPTMLAIAIASNFLTPVANSQTPPPPEDTSQSLTINSDIQEADSKSGIFTARGNVQIFYPARQIQATAAQAQYYQKERKIVLSGNVNVLQQGNTLKGESITYLIDRGRFIATPKANQQVRSTYIVNDANPQTSTPAPATPNFKPKQPASKPSTPTAPKR